MINKGDLVYLPSAVILTKMEGSVVKGYVKTSKPASVLVIDESQHFGHYKVMYDGEEWYVDNSDVRR